MQITLEHDEILSALDAYVRTQINLSENQSIDIDIKAGRGANGFSAILDIRTSVLATYAKPSRPVAVETDDTVDDDEPEELTSSFDPDEVEDIETDDDDDEDEAPKPKKALFA